MKKRYPADSLFVLVMAIAILMAIGFIHTGNELTSRFLSLLNNILGLYIAMDKLSPPR